MDRPTYRDEKRSDREKKARKWNKKCVTMCVWTWSVQVKLSNEEEEEEEEE